MEPTKLSQAIEENLIELFSWLYLFPITLFDLLRHPLTFLDRMALEGAKTEGSRFDARMSPVLFLVAGTVPLSVVIEKGDRDAADMPQLSDAALVLALTIAALPFVWALCSIAASRQNLGRQSFRAAFGAQCYLFCPGWFVVLLVAAAGQRGNLSVGLEFIGLIAAFIWTASTEWRLLKRTCGWAKASGYFVVGVAFSVVAMKAIILLAIATHQKWLYNAD